MDKRQKAVLRFFLMPLFGNVFLGALLFCVALNSAYINWQV